MGNPEFCHDGEAEHPADRQRRIDAELRAQEQGDSGISGILSELGTIEAGEAQRMEPGQYTWLLREGVKFPLQRLGSLRIAIQEEREDSFSLAKFYEQQVVPFRKKLAPMLQGGKAVQPGLLWGNIEKLRSAEFANSPNAADEYVSLLQNGEPLRETIMKLVRDGNDERVLLQMFVNMASASHPNDEKRREDMRQIAKGEHPVCRYALAANSVGPHANHVLLYENIALGWLRIIKIFAPLSYNRLHKNGMYLFTETNEPNHFAHVLANDPQGCIKGKKVLTVGAGNGVDEILFADKGASEVHMIEGSPFMIERLKERQKTLPTQQSQKLYIPDEPVDMIQEMQEIANGNDRFDTIYGHSVFHYDDDPTLDGLLSLVHSCLEQKESSRFAFAVKAPGAILDHQGAGYSLIKETGRVLSVSDNQRPRVWGEDVQCRMWHNLDGQSRAFRGKHALSQIVSRYFDIVSQTDHMIEDYETTGQPPQRFYYFVCKWKRLQQASTSPMRV